MKITCDVIRDLLPLAVEEIASPDSMEVVRRHLESCEGCRAELEALKQPVQIPAEEPGMGRIKREMIRRRWLAVLCGMLAVLLAVSCVGCWLFNPIYLPKTVVESVELGGEWADLGRTTYVRIWASPTGAGYRSISCDGRQWEDGIQYVVFYTTRYRELMQEIPEEEFVSVRSATNTIWLFSEDGTMRLLHGVPKGEELPAQWSIPGRLCHWTAITFLVLLALGLLLRKKQIGRRALSLSALCYCYIAAQDLVSGELNLSFFWKRELLWAVLIAGCVWGIGMCIYGLRSKR